MTELEPSLIPTRKEYSFWDEKARDRAIAHVRAHGKYPSLMAKAAGVSYQTLRHYLKEDQEFADLVQAALDERNLELETEARRRAVEGVTRKKWDKDGNLLEEEKVYSDRLMEKLLEANDPSKFRPREKDGGTNAVGGVLLIPIVTDGSVSDPQRLMDRLAELSEGQRILQENGERAERSQHDPD